MFRITCDQNETYIGEILISLIGETYTIGNNGKNFTLIVIGDELNCYYFKFIDVLILFINNPQRGWADPGGTAIPGQPVAGAVQALYSHLFPKISLIFWGPFGPVSDIKLIRTDTTL